MNVVVVNGKKYTTTGGSISVIGNKVYCDGELLSDCDEFKEKVINITVNGNVDGYVKTTSGNIKLQGSVGEIETTSGDVDIVGNVGNVKTVSGNVKAKKILGNVKTVSGDIAKSFL